MIVVTAPTSTIGRQVVKTVVDSGVDVRVIARTPSRLAPEIRARVEVIEGSHADGDVVNTAFAGADTVFWLVPSDPAAAGVEAAYVDFSRPACDALRTHGVKRVVGISALGRGTVQAKTGGHVTASLKMGDMIMRTGVGFRELALPGFMDNILRQAASIKAQGLFFGTMPGSFRAPTCATRDIAAVAARLLLDPTWSGQGHVAVLGPEDLSFDDMAHIMSDVLDRPIVYQEISTETLRSTLTGGGYSAAMAQALIDMMIAKRNGLDSFEPRTPQSNSPTSFRQFCIEVLKPAVFG
eukprot:gene28751-32132_t